MNKMIFFRWVILLPLVCGQIFGDTILVNSEEGNAFIIEVDPAESLGELQDRIASLAEGKKMWMEIPADKEQKNFSLALARSQGGSLGYPRNYFLDVTSDEKADIRFIVTSLANKSLISIAMIKGDLEAAGDRIDHVHPLRFLLTIFTDEELKVGIRNIRGKGWVWNHFVASLKSCLASETGIGNMKDEFVQHFAQTVNINSNYLMPFIQSQDWENFVDQLITHIPRVGNHDRYDTSRNFPALRKRSMRS